MNGVKTKSKQVNKFEDSDEKLELSVSFDRREPEPWIIVSCDSDNISLSLKNWEILQDLVNKTLSD